MSIDVGYIADNRRFSVAPNPGSDRNQKVRFDSGRPAQARAREHLDSREDRLDPGRGLERVPLEPGACMEACGISCQALMPETSPQAATKKAGQLTRFSLTTRNSSMRSAGVVGRRR